MGLGLGLGIAAALLARVVRSNFETEAETVVGKLFVLQILVDFFNAGALGLRGRSCLLSFL